MMAFTFSFRFGESRPELRPVPCATATIHVATSAPIPRHRPDYPIPWGHTKHFCLLRWEWRVVGNGARRKRTFTPPQRTHRTVGGTAFSFPSPRPSLSGRVFVRSSVENAISTKFSDKVSKIRGPGTGLTNPESPNSRARASRQACRPCHYPGTAVARGIFVCLTACRPRQRLNT